MTTQMGKHLEYRMTNKPQKQHNCDEDTMRDNLI